jgi:hypothetical protein
LLESDIQIQVVEYLKLIPNIVFHSVPNEAFAPKRGKLTGPQLSRMKKFKRMGLLAGVADLVITHKGLSYYLELKTPKGTITDSQKKFKADALKAGAKYEIARSLDQAVSILKLWGIT